MKSKVLNWGDNYGHTRSIYDMKESHYWFG